jgi:hypothetical protein
VAGRGEPEAVAVAGETERPNQPSGWTAKDAATAGYCLLLLHLWCSCWCWYACNEQGQQNAREGRRREIVLNGAVT